MLCQVLADSEEGQVLQPVVFPFVVLVVHVHPFRDGSVRLGPHEPVQQSSVLVLVVTVLAGVPFDACVLDGWSVFSHVKTVSFVRTNEACFHPVVVHTSWSGVSHTWPAPCSYRRTSFTPLSQTRRTWRRPFRVHTRSPGRMSSMGRGPCSVRMRVPSRTHELPPARRRSTSSGVCDPKSLAWEPLGQRMTVPPGACTRRAPGSALRMPPGPSYMEVTPSPRVGAMMAIQWGTAPGRQGGPLTCWRTYSAQAFDLPAPRPAMRSQPVQLPSGGIWCGCGCQRGLSWAPRRAAARAATVARSSVPMAGLSVVRGRLSSGA